MSRISKESAIVSYFQSANLDKAMVLLEVIKGIMRGREPQQNKKTPRAKTNEGPKTALKGKEVEETETK